MAYYHQKVAPFQILFVNMGNLFKLSFVKNLQNERHRQFKKLKVGCICILFVSFFTSVNH